MRTTVTIDPDVEALLARAMRERNLSFKEALNQALRNGLLAGFAQRPPIRVELPTASLGLRSGVNFDKALAIADALEDEELMRELERGQ